MPIYVFECRDCRQRFEELIGAGARAPGCPNCGSPHTARRWSPVSPPARMPRGAGARDSESRRAEREAERSQRLAETKRRRAAGEL